MKEKAKEFVKGWGAAIVAQPYYHAASAGAAVILAFAVRFLTK